MNHLPSTITAIESNDHLSLVDVVAWQDALLVGNQNVRVIASADEAQHLKPGERVTLLSKAFSPVLMGC